MGKFLSSSHQHFLTDLGFVLAPACLLNYQPPTLSAPYTVCGVHPSAWSASLLSSILQPLLERGCGKLIEIHVTISTFKISY